VSWVDNSDGTAAFKIERRPGTAGTYAQIATTGVGVTTFVDTTVVAGSAYCYRVRASSPLGNSAYSEEACGSPTTGLVVTVDKAGTGSGTVLSSPIGINCGTDCVGSYAAGQVVTLTATPASGSIFNGWSGSCAGTAPCTITGNTSVRVTATFSRTTTGTAAGASLSASPATVQAGKPVTATWSGISGPSATDWIGLYTPSAANDSPRAWIYVSCTTTAGSARAAGTCPLGVPTGLAPGTYQLRLFARNGYTRLATSQLFTVTR
jgi:hypothetical protein